MLISARVLVQVTAVTVDDGGTPKRAPGVTALPLSAQRPPTGPTDLIIGFDQNQPFIIIVKFPE